MSAMDPPSPGSDTTEVEQPLTRLPFPPLRKSHIIHCSYHYWHPKYRSITPKARLVPLTQPFLDYLRADGIVLPDDEDERRTLSDDDSGIFSATDDDAEDEDEDIAAEWRDVHDAIKSTIAELGGKVVPKLNWSAPKDATWISATNSLECRTPNDIYLLLKSSDFVTHDLEHAFDDCADDDDDDENITENQPATDTATTTPQIPYVLALRKFVQLNPSVEFRCFVRHRTLLGICQRDLNHFDFLFSMQDSLRDLIQDFFDRKLRDTFPDEDFTFDVYVPPPHDRVWIVDFNPWAIRTDPLLFSWLELLTMRAPGSGVTADGAVGQAVANGTSREDGDEEDGEEAEDADEELAQGPEFRLVKRDDPEAYLFNSTRYSAHKLPRDVVDASQSGVGGLREFADNWRDILARRQREDQDAESSESD